MPLVVLLALLGAVAAACAFRLVLEWRASIHLLGLVTLGGIVLALPAIIPAEERLTRLLVAGYSGLLCMKMWDLRVGAVRGNLPSLTEYLLFLLNPGSLVQRSSSRMGPRSARSDLVHLGMGAGVATLGITAFFWLVDHDWSSASPILEHALKAPSFFLIITGLFTGIAATTRLCGGRTPRPTDFPLLAPTPARFWSGLNRVVGEFLREDVLRVIGARRRPTTAVLIAFGVSGLVHEYAFAMATGGLQGFQIVFFMIHGVAVAATRGWSGIGWGGRVVTLAFNLATSVLFLASFEAVAPGVFFQGGLPIPLSRQ